MLATMQAINKVCCTSPTVYLYTFTVQSQPIITTPPSIKSLYAIIRIRCCPARRAGHLGWHSRPPLQGSDTTKVRTNQQTSTTMLSDLSATEAASLATAIQGPAAHCRHTPIPTSLVILQPGLHLLQFALHLLILLLEPCLHAQCTLPPCPTACCGAHLPRQHMAPSHLQSCHEVLHARTASQAHTHHKETSAHMPLTGKTT